jgi:hypothetical protein
MLRWRRRTEEAGVGQGVWSIIGRGTVIETQAIREEMQGMTLDTYADFDGLGLAALVKAGEA